MESSVKLLGIEIDNKLNFEEHISNICKKSQQSTKRDLHTAKFMGHKEKEAMINTRVHSNFNDGCLIWHFSSKKSQNIAKKIHERSLKILSNDYLSRLLEKSTSVSMETKRFSKTLNNLNPVFMKVIFHYSPNVTDKKHNLYIHNQNTTTFGSKSLRDFGANILNTLPEYIKSTTSLLQIKKFTKTWPGPKYKCSLFK